MPLLYFFIDEYMQCELPGIKSFASGLSKDIEAVENAVASNLSNGFFEGTNSKLKMVKRSMYGRCNIQLLSCYENRAKTDNCGITCSVGICNIKIKPKDFNKLITLLASHYTSLIYPKLLNSFLFTINNASYYQHTSKHSHD